MQNILVIRFSSLGDLCLLGWSLARLAGSPGGKPRRVVLVTKPAFAPLMAQMRGIDEVAALDEPGLGGLWGLAKTLRSTRWDAVIDAHGVLRSQGLLMFMGRRPERRINKDTTRRLAMLRGITASGLDQRTMRQRFDEVMADLESGGNPHQTAPLSHLRPTTTPEGGILGLAPGAQWATKRWPQEYFAALLHEFRTGRQVPVRVFLGPREEDWFAGSDLAAACADLPEIEIIRQQPLPEVATRLAECTALVTNDSGLLHLAEAAGTPVLAFFGPTVRHFGYFPCLPGSEVLEVELDCRPCSRNGKRPCHREDLACLREITPDRAKPWLDRMFTA